MPEHIAITGGVETRKLKLAGMIAVGVAALILVGGLLARSHANQSLKTWTHEQSIATVSLAKIGQSGAQGFALPASIEAFYTAPIHARVSGYLKKWYVDIGAPVKAGQILAEIETPETDQQVLQARADLATAEASLSLSQTTAKRWAGLLAKDAVSRQEADEKQGDLAVRLSAVKASMANLNRLLALESFKRITAPFDGVVTSRNTDIGALISVGGAADSALFTVADQHRLRVYVRVPQSQSSLIHRGMQGRVTVPEYPGETFVGAIVNDAEAVDARTGTVLMEVLLDNADGRLKGGSYAQVAFDLPSAAKAANIPSTALLFRDNGVQVALVGPDSRVILRPVVIGRDLGPTVDIGSGIAPNERLIDNPPEALANGDLVRVVSPANGAAHARL